MKRMCVSWLVLIGLMASMLAYGQDVSPLEGGQGSDTTPLAQASGGQGQGGAGGLAPGGAAGGAAAGMSSASIAGIVLGSAIAIGVVAASVGGGGGGSSGATGTTE
ncbi:hypothetical protein [Halomonas sp. YLGW01]|uniref:hypothetical protein n=1 Tax=Halomonas sp. YLGW01 TaxID=2773308 RepID=UPI001785B325|nr:hypothetical protein [Halomonas sp. YLGW01]